MKAIKRALVSVFDKKGLNEFVKELVNDFKLYLNEDPGTLYPEFWYWHSTVYFPQTIYPFLDSLRWNQE